MDAAIARNTSADNLALVIRANHFTHKIDDGYLMRGSRRVGDLMSAAEVGAYIAANPSTKVEFLRT